jgi:hypothetical protein
MGDVLDPADEENLDCAVHIARDIFGAVGIGIGRYDRWWMIPLSKNTGYEVLDECEASDLVDEYTAKGGGIDVFLVQAFSYKVVGTHPWKGDGVVVASRDQDFVGTARTFCHELGHYFGLGHEDAKDNLMCQSDDAKEGPFAAVRLRRGQVKEIKEHDEMCLTLLYGRTVQNLFSMNLDISLRRK